MLHNAKTFLVHMSLALIFLGAPLPAKSQDAEVEIDMTVLGDIKPAAGADSAQGGLPISRPIERPARPTLTQPTISSPTIQHPKISTPVIETPIMKPTVFKPTEVKPAVNERQNVDPVRVENNGGMISSKELMDYPVNPEAKIRPPVRKREKPRIISFPIEEKVRSDSTNPSLVADDLNEVIPQAGTSAAKNAAQVPMPPLKPVAIPSVENLPKAAIDRADVGQATKPKKAVEKIYAYTGNVPIPGRRPSRQMASKSFVNTARIHAVRDVSKAGMDMPALPAKRVFAEPLSAPPDIGLKLGNKDGSGMRTVQNDDLARKLKTPNKEEMVASIERMAEVIEAIHGKKNTTKVVPNPDRLEVPKLKKPELASDGESIHPVFAVPLEVPTPERKPIAVSAASNDLLDPSDKPVIQNISALEPAAGVEESDDEMIDITESVPAAKTILKAEKTAQIAAFGGDKDAFSIPFANGQVDADENMYGTLNSAVVQRMRGDLSLRLQLQSFAVPDGKNIKNARRGSLSRALSIRKYLIDQGIEASRIDVRALGDTENLDRVDLLLVNPNG